MASGRPETDAVVRSEQLASSSLATPTCSANHQKFLSHLESSSQAVWSVAEMLNHRGYNVTIPTATRAEAHGDWKMHADSGDLFINQRVEVKQLTVEFTSADDWPFGRKFIVCAKHAFDRATPKPYSFVILSSSGRHAAVVFATDSRTWTVETRTDRRYDNVSQEFYFSPMDRVCFFPMPNSN
jgi:hypothetical protein